MSITLQSAIATFGKAVKEKLSNPVMTGQPEDQLRAPFETLLLDLAELCQIKRDDVTAVGESALTELKTRPDYSVTVRNALVGFVELKAPGKGANPKRFKGHDKAQWQKLQTLPNLIYSDGNSFSLWQNGELVGSIVSFDEDIETAGKNLTPPQGLLDLFQSFFLWEPIPPTNAQELARITANLCRLLRDEVVEQMALGSEALTSLAEDWRNLLFPDATDEKFADGYAQAVTFGLLMARAKNIELATGLDRAARDLKSVNSLMGTALRLLTDNLDDEAILKTSLNSLVRVLDAVDWEQISKGDPETWLYFYEDFLEVYDNKLRKETGSYYTPPAVVENMVRLVNELLKDPSFGLQEGLASSAVTVVDPATGTGTYMLAVLKKIAESVSDDYGEGSVTSAINAALKRLIAFELQLGPFTVAQLRILAEVLELTNGSPTESLRMFVTDTLGDPEDDQGWIPQMFAPIAESRRAANQIKREEPVTVVIGNPPYKDKAKGRGGWVESGNPRTDTPAPLDDWQPPKNWKIGTHAKHLRNLYIYFWRWATWKVFDHHPENNSGIICFITVAGFIAGPGFQRMRQYLRETCDNIWVIDCSPDGHQPGVNTRIFQGVQQPVCIVLASRSKKKQDGSLANVKFRALPLGAREDKFAALDRITLSGEAWEDCMEGSRAPFLPESEGKWSTYPTLNDFFNYDGSGVMPGRTWVIAPDVESLEKRWQALQNAPIDKKEELFHPHGSGDRTVAKKISDSLAGQPQRNLSVTEDKNDVVTPVKYGYRSFDRQWIIPDKRLINRPNPKLWEWHSDNQIYLATPDRPPTDNCAVTYMSLIPDLNSYNGRGGRIIPLWQTADCSDSNVKRAFLDFLSNFYEDKISAEDFFAYIAGVVANPAYTKRFQEDLQTPGIRVPLTADLKLFQEAVALGKRVIWLHTFSERMIDATDNRPSGHPRLPKTERPTIPKDGTIPNTPEEMPDDISYDANKKRLLVGSGFVENVPPEVWHYNVSGKQIVKQWFSYRKKDRSRPIIGDRRHPSPLNQIQPDHWLDEYTRELLNLLNVLGLLIKLEPQQADLLEHICEGETISLQTLKKTNALAESSVSCSQKNNPDQLSLL
ncbi:type ISP restriction/modification enzyme [Picosynechococcus sp. PCC 7117]|uniref:type ISP restriction/modification enzyme n=1 Tax=Picosynechococcus sp. PCC 7117 TaxID=195498 RepID=UPI0008105D84|nr:type ISP restriction/modification enzyme [Picosynechococcus sp. PCC 7117]ANV87614.1 DNA methyltransferase [Picosynechococcus sp. PCC 7117]